MEDLPPQAPYDEAVDGKRMEASFAKTLSVATRTRYTVA